MKIKRGAFIVVEGLDRTGKSTQCKNLVNNLNLQQVKTEYTNFPARNTEIGRIINSYLKTENDLPDEAIHLLFSANRWERAKEIVKTLKEGTSVIVDRYCYSGVAFSAAKGLSLEWCKCPDAGLPKPDKVFFLTMPIDQVQNRLGYGDERYEILPFQRKVAEMYLKLKDETWVIIDANRSIEKIEEELLSKSLKIVKKVQNKPIGKIWVDSSKKVSSEQLENI